MLKHESHNHTVSSVSIATLGPAATHPKHSNKKEGEELKDMPLVVVVSVE